MASIQDARDGVQRQPGLVRKQCGFSDNPQQIVRHLGDGDALRSKGGCSPGEGLHQRMEKELRSDHDGGDPTGLKRYQPGGQQQAQAGYREQAAAQVVKNLPAIEPGKRVRASPTARQGDPRHDPIRNLPIATNPAMLPLDKAQIILRELIIELDIAGQAHADVSAFDQIMAEEPRFGEPAGKHPAEGAHIIDAFAVVGALAGQVLIDIGNRIGIGIDADRVGKEPAERRAAHARQGRAHARLDDRIAGQDPAFVIESCLVQRMRQGLDQPAGSAVWQLRVAVQSDDKPYVGELIRVADVKQCGPPPVAACHRSAH